MLQYVLSALSDAVLAYNLTKQQFMFISPAVATVFGRSPDDFNNNPQLLNEIIHTGDQSKIKEQTKDLTLPGETTITYRIITPENQVKWVEEKRVLFRHEESGDEICLNIIKDITENVLYRADAEEKVWFLSSLINAVGALIFRIDTKGNYTFINDIYTQQLGYMREELLGKPIWQVVHPDDVDMLKSCIQDALAQPGKIFHIRHRKITADGRLRWVVTDAVAVTNRSGKVTEIQGVGLDMTDQYMAKEEILWTKNNLEALINNTHDLIWSIDLDKKYVFVNTAFKSWIKQMYGTEPKEHMRVNNKAIYPGEVADNWERHYDRALAGETFEVSFKEQEPDSDTITNFEVSFNPIKKANGEVMGVGCFAHNATERLAIQQAVLKQNEKLLHIASLSSHELRRPVATLMGLITLFDHEDMTNPENADIIVHIQAVAHELDGVIRQIVNKTFIKEG